MFKTGLQEEGNWYKLKQIDFVQVFFLQISFNLLWDT